MSRRRRANVWIAAVWSWSSSAWLYSVPDGVHIWRLAKHQHHPADDQLQDGVYNAPIKLQIRQRLATRRQNARDRRIRTAKLAKLVIPAGGNPLQSIVSLCRCSVGEYLRRRCLFWRIEFRRRHFARRELRFSITQPTTGD